MLNLSDIVQKEFGENARIRSINTTDSIGTTIVRILGNNPRRIGFTIINLSTNSLYALQDGGVSTTNGILISPSGGFLSYNYQTEGNAVGEEVFVVADGVNSSITLIEFELV